MAEQRNQHFVPKYIFRSFNEGHRYIHLVTKTSSKLFFYASVRHQCARNNFYGDQDIETQLAELDARHSAAYRAAIQQCWSATPTQLSADDTYSIYEGFLLQRARTPRAADNYAFSSEEITLNLFRTFIQESADKAVCKEVLRAIDEKHVELKMNPELAILGSLSIALQSVIGIIDLKLSLLRNLTQLPFVFGDSPCVYYNRYVYGVPTLNGLGIQSRGLMIFMPLNSTTQVMLYDPATYSLQDTRLVTNLIDNSDVSQLNALQVHSADACIYFADRSHSEYVCSLTTAHRPLFRAINSAVRLWKPGEILIDDKPNDKEVLHTFENQLPLKLDLSFVATKALDKNENPRRPRSPELRRELMDRLNADSSPDG